MTLRTLLIAPLFLAACATDSPDPDPGPGTDGETGDATTASTASDSEAEGDGEDTGPGTDATDTDDGGDDTGADDTGDGDGDSGDGDGETGDGDTGAGTGGPGGESGYADILPGDPYQGDPEEFTVNHDGLDLYVRTFGGGDEYVFVVNGGPGQSHHYCESADVLATTEVTVVTFDQRGTGVSTFPSDPEAFHLDDLAADMEAIRAHLGAERIHVIGHSFGGLYSMAYATAHPERVASLQLYSSSGARQPDADNSEFEARIAMFEANGTFPEGYADVEEGETDCAPYFQTIWPVYLFDIAFPMTPSLLATTCNLDAFAGFANAHWLGWDLSDQTQQFDGRVAIYWGEADPFLVESTSIGQHFGSAELTETEIPECGHYWEECMDAFFSDAAQVIADEI